MLIFQGLKVELPELFLINMLWRIGPGPLCACQTDFNSSVRNYAKDFQKASTTHRIYQPKPTLFYRIWNSLLNRIGSLEPMGCAKFSDSLGPARLFNKRNPAKSTGRPALNPRVLIGAVIIKHMPNLDDRETIAQITENSICNIFWGIVPISNGLPLMPPFLWILENDSAKNWLPRWTIRSMNSSWTKL